jgi:hypothetical protein
MTGHSLSNFKIICKTKIDINMGPTSIDEEQFKFIYF